ncbi:hypothetical protein F5148DRAFT_1146075 [Russula earlei]|uniref:Uncharacterized protein n=1 Tax=Russula earlei TaxID=71964 RepID=A0ACC0UMQ5_9AGAM|nr:hypothetical protein F5148DRAFT_1146075 [Russula earlei]
MRALFQEALAQWAEGAPFSNAMLCMQAQVGKGRGLSKGEGARRKLLTRMMMNMFRQSKTAVSNYRTRRQTARRRVGNEFRPTDMICRRRNGDISDRTERERHARVPVGPSTHSQVIGTDGQDYTMNGLIRRGEAAAAISDEKQGRHWGDLNKDSDAKHTSGDGQLNCSLITHTTKPTMLKKKAERTTRTSLRLPENAYERNMRMTAPSGSGVIDYKPTGRAESGVAYTVTMTTVSEVSGDSRTGRIVRAHRGYGTSVEHAVVRPTDAFLVIREKPPEEERRDDQRIVATEQIRTLHGVPRGWVYLRSNCFSKWLPKQRPRAYKRNFLVQPVAKKKTGRYLGTRHGTSIRAQRHDRRAGGHESTTYGQLNETIKISPAFG